MIRFFLALSFLAPLWVATAFAEADLDGFMTPRDILSNNTASNIYLQNGSAASVNVYGLYVRRLAEVLPGGSCAAPLQVIYPSTDIPAANVTAGAMVSPVQINPGLSAPIGSNYLYNMIFNANYYVHVNISSSPPGCSLPGCTWGDDTTVYHWCIYLGALGPVSNSADYTSTVPPPAYAASDTIVPGSDYYDYNMINSSDYIYVGPISCNDQTLTCSVATQQTQPL